MVHEIKGELTKLREKYLSLTGYRLLTEAEMEYATRAGAVDGRCFARRTSCCRSMRGTTNSQDKTWPVGSLKPNDLGLFDLHGNAYTWCQRASSAYPTGKGDEAVEDREDGLVIINAERRVLRGGSSYSWLDVRLPAVSSVPSNRNGYYCFRLGEDFSA